MKVVVGVLLAFLLAYQLMFRYEHWTEPSQPGVMFERDSLTGQVHKLAPGQKVDFIGRLLGDYGERSSGKDKKDKTETAQDMGTPPEPVSMAAIGTTAETGKSEAKAASEAARAIESFVTRQIDLNRDGANEEIIQSVTVDDGLLDISIVQGGREVFYARGKQLNILPSQQAGWSDLMLSPDGRSEVYFRYQANLHAYKRLEGRI